MEIQEKIQRLREKKSSERVLQAQTERRLIGETDDDITELLIILFELVGLSEEKYPSNAKSLICYIKVAFSKYSMTDLINAFDFGIQGLTDDRPPSLNSYNSFSQTYLERVMQAYKRYSYPIIVEAKMKHNQEPEDKKLSPEEAEKRIREGCLQAFDQHKKGIKIVDFASPKYNFLTSKGLIKTTPDELNHYTRLANTAIHSTNFKKPLDIVNTVEGETKLLILKGYFDDLITIGKELKDILNDQSN